jgi:CubicO group peptidase (beta-lactamase class C family)
MASHRSHPRACAQRALFSLFVLVFLIVPAARAAVSDADLARSVDELFSRTYPASGPGAAVLIKKDGQVLLRKGYGMANVELGVPIEPDMVFELASVTKQLTAAAILMLQESGKLSVEDDITRYLPDYPTHGQKITIHHLLTHTSGIPNFTALPEWWPRRREDLTVQQIIDLVKDKPLNFNPGEKLSYSNSGYILLGAIIEKASEKSYEDFIEQEIFAPLGMKRSRYNHQNEMVPGRVAGYELGEDGYQVAEFISRTQGYAAGGLMSTVDDMALWAEALTSEKLLRRSSLERMTTPAKLSSGEPTPAGYGLGIMDEDGIRILEHDGGIPGFNTNILIIPDRRLQVIVLSNFSGQEPGAGGLAYRVAMKVLGKEGVAVNLDPTTLAEYVGVYRFDEKLTRVVRREGNKLLVHRLGGQQYEIQAASQDAFFHRDSDSRLRFLRDTQGKITGMEFRRRFGPGEVGVRSDEPLPAERQAVQVDPSVYDGYTGVYELGPDVLTVTREGDHLMAKITGEPKTEIFPESDSRFFLKVADVQLEFQRGPDGKATGILMVQGDQTIPGRKIR